ARLGVLDIFAASRQPSFLAVIRTPDAELDAALVLQSVRIAQVDDRLIIGVNQVIQGPHGQHAGGVKSEKAAELLGNTHGAVAHTMLERADAASALRNAQLLVGA